MASSAATRSVPKLTARRNGTRSAAEADLAVPARLQHVLVCVTAADGDPLLVRSGRTLAERLGGRLSVLYAFVPGDAPRPRGTLAAIRALARACGAPLIEVPAYSAADGIAEF